MKANPNKVQRMEGSREGLVEASREDIKDLWEAAGNIFIVWKSDEDMSDGRGWCYLAARKPGGSWTELERILDLTKMEFKAEAGRMFELDSDQWDFDSDEENEDEENEDEENEDEKDENRSTNPKIGELRHLLDF